MDLLKLTDEAAILAIDGLEEDEEEEEDQNDEKVRKRNFAFTLSAY
jgi:hypothetical protein